MRREKISEEALQQANARHDQENQANPWGETRDGAFSRLASVGTACAQMGDVAMSNNQSNLPPIEKNYFAGFLRSIQTASDQSAGSRLRMLYSLTVSKFTRDSSKY